MNSISGKRILIVAIIGVMTFILCSTGVFQTLNANHTLSSIETAAITKKVQLVSDMHIGAGTANNLQYDKFILDVNSNTTPDALLMLGDETNAGSIYQLYHFYNQTKNLSSSVLEDSNTFVIPGNHDMASTTYYTIWERWRTLFSYMPNWTYMMGNILFITIPTSGFYVYGEVTDSQLDWVNATISANTDKNIVILSHHPLSNTTFYSDSQDRSWKITSDNKLKGMAYYQRFNISAWISGHDHGDDGFDGIDAYWNGIYMIDISAYDAQSSPYNALSWVMTLTDNSKDASMTPRHVGMGSGTPSTWNSTNTKTFQFKYAVDLTSSELKDEESDWEDTSSVSLTNFRKVGDSIWTDLNPVNDSNTELLYKFNEFGHNGVNHSIKDWSGGGHKLLYNADHDWINWSYGNVSDANDGGGLLINGIGTTRGAWLETDDVPLLRNMTKNFTLDYTFRYNGAVAGGTRSLVYKGGEFIWGWDTSAWRMSLTLWYSDSSTSIYYLNFAPNHTVTPRTGSIIHMVASVNTYDRTFRGWFNDAYLGEAKMVAKTWGQLSVYQNYFLAYNHQLDAVLYGFKLSRVASPDGVRSTSTLVIKNPTETNPQLVLGNVINGHLEGTFQYSSRMTVTYSNDNVNYSSRERVPNGKTMYMKVVISSEGTAGGEITAAGLRTANAGFVIGAGVSYDGTYYYGNGTYDRYNGGLMDMIVTGELPVNINSKSALNFTATQYNGYTDTFRLSGLTENDAYRVTKDGHNFISYQEVTGSGQFNFTNDGNGSACLFELEYKTSISNAIIGLIPLILMAVVISMVMLFKRF